MPEELKELGNEDVQWSVNSITVQGLCIVFTDLLQCSKCSLQIKLMLLKQNYTQVNLSGHVFQSKTKEEKV